MRTTIVLEPDVAAAVERLRKERSLGLSAAVNTLIRGGLRKQPAARRFEQRSTALGIRIDVANVADALEQLDGPATR